MTSLAVQPVQWGKLDDLEDIAILDDTDMECMAAVRDTLLRFGKVDRFALQLAHRPFDIKEDEILVEYGSAERRESFLRPEKYDSATVSNTIPTAWILKDTEPSVIGVGQVSH